MPQSDGLNPNLNIPYFLFGDYDGNFDEGTIGGEYIPESLAGYKSVGPNPGIIRLIVAFLKDTLGTGKSSLNTILVTQNGENIPIVNIFKL